MDESTLRGTRSKDFIYDEALWSAGGGPRGSGPSRGSPPPYIITGFAIINIVKIKNIYVKNFLSPRRPHWRPLALIGRRLIGTASEDLLRMPPGHSVFQNACRFTSHKYSNVRPDSLGMPPTFILERGQN